MSTGSHPTRRLSFLAGTAYGIVRPPADGATNQEELFALQLSLPDGSGKWASLNLWKDTGARPPSYFVYPMNKIPVDNYKELLPDVKPFTNLYEKTKELTFFTRDAGTQKNRKEVWRELRGVQNAQIAEI